MAISISAAEQDAVEVDLWGTVFHAVTVTRSRHFKLLDLQKRFNAIEDDTDPAQMDESVAVLAEMLDNYLAPEPGKRKLPSAIIKAKWEADELSFVRLLEFIEELSEAAKRPI